MSFSFGHTGPAFIQDNPLEENKAIETDDFHFYFTSKFKDNCFVKSTAKWDIALFGNINTKKKFDQFWENLDIDRLIKEEVYVIDFFNCINGIYGLCMYNKPNKTVYLCTDPLGFYPMYYLKYKNQLCWASEQSALLKKREIHFSWNQAAMKSYITNGHLLAQQSWFNEIQKVPPGKFLVYNQSDDNLKFQIFWSWSQIQKSDLTIEELIEAYHSTFISNIGDLNIKEEIVSISLSGGLDSRYIASVIHKKFQLKAFTFSEGDSYDLNIAKKIAQKLNIQHRHYDIQHKEMIRDRMSAFLKTDGMLHLGHIHESNLHDLIAKEQGTYFHGFYGGGVYANKKSNQQRINKNLASHWFKAEDKELQIENEFYNFMSIDPFIVDQRMRNTSGMSIYLLSQYCKVVIPFYDMAWLKLNYSIPEYEQLNQKFYLKVLNKFLPKTVVEEPWQKTGIPIKCIRANIMALQLHWPGIRERILNNVGKTSHFIQYQNHFKEIKSVALDYGLANDGRCYPKTIDDYFQYISLKIWQQYIHKQHSNVF